MLVLVLQQRGSGSGGGGGGNTSCVKSGFSTHHILTIAALSQNFAVGATLLASR